MIFVPIVVVILICLLTAVMVVFNRKRCAHSNYSIPNTKCKHIQHIGLALSCYKSIKYI